MGEASAETATVPLDPLQHQGLRAALRIVGAEHDAYEALRASVSGNPLPTIEIPREQEQRTELGNASRFAEEYPERVRYARGIGWLVYDGIRWSPDRTGAVDRLAKDTVRRLFPEALDEEEEEKKKKMLAHALRSQSCSAIRALLKLAETEDALAVTAEAFDHDPMLFNAQNGTLDLRTYGLRPHESRAMLTKVAGAPFDPQSACPQWEQFVSRVLGGNERLIHFMRKALGYSLTGKTDEQVLFFLYGLGKNGKSTLLEVVRSIFGEYAKGADFSTLAPRRGEGPREDIARLFGARFVTAIEAGAGAAFNEVVVKQLTGGDSVTARHLYQGSFEFQPQFKIWIAANHKPVVRGTDTAVWRRIMLVPFTVEIPADERDPNLKNKLLEEAPGILAWMVEGCRLWKDEGLAPPPEVLAATAAYREEMDPIGGFLSLPP